VVAVVRVGRCSEGGSSGGGRGLWRRGRRVVASGVWDRVDRKVGNLFGFAGKSPPEKFFGGSGDGRLAGGGLPDFGGEEINLCVYY
nr:hypothetical protein [Tanacetum cinerariifolium]